MAHGDAREGNWRGKWRMQWVASTLHTTSEHGVSSITTADAHTSAASSRMNWRPSADLNGLVRFAERRNLGFCACAIAFELASNTGRRGIQVKFIQSLPFGQLVCGLRLFLNYLMAFNQSLSSYNRTALIQVNWDGETPGYAENPDNWIFLSKQAT